MEDPSPSSAAEPNHDMDYGSEDFGGAGGDGGGYNGDGGGYNGEDGGGGDDYQGGSPGDNGDNNNTNNDDAFSSASGSLVNPDDPVLAPVQQRYEKHLRRQLEEAALNLKETNLELKTAKQKREDVGVELYNVQQQLARLQEQLEKFHDQYGAMAKLREEKEKERTEILHQYDEDKKHVEDLRKKYFKYQTELDKLSETLLRVEQFNEQMQSEISIERRAAYKAEEEIAVLEKNKQKQDFLIDNLNEQVRQLTENLAMYESQLDTQKKETRIAQETLTDALAEMQAIQFEKKQLMQQWKTSLIGMQRRDEALRATEEALEQQKEALMALDNEIRGYKLSIKKEQEQNERLTHVLGKTENEVNFLEKQIDSLLEKKQNTSNKYTMLKKSLENTDAESKRLDQDCKTIENELGVMEKQAQKIHREIRKLEDNVLETLNAQSNLKKGSQSTLQQIEKMKVLIRDKELLVTQVENELSRIRVDTLQTQAHNEVLKGTLTELEKEVQSNDYLIERMRVDIRRKHDEIERKQKNLDKLNRQYDECVAQQGNEAAGEGVGPLEATINNLSKAITLKSSENDQLQRDWVKAQTQLVNKKNFTSKLNESIMELRAQSTILQQKKLRLTGQSQQLSVDIRQLEQMIKAMHARQKKLNELIAMNQSKASNVSDDAFNLENDLVQRLSERRRETIDLENRITDMRDEKNRLLGEVLEAERQTLFWEKKIQIAKETEQMLDPNIGKEEINRMKQEIYVMEQRLAALKREQKKKVEEMTRAIDHRDVLRTKGKAVQLATETKMAGQLTKVQLQRENARLMNDLKKKKAEAQDKDKQIKSCLQNTENTASEIDRLSAENDNLRQQLSDLQFQVHSQTIQRNLHMDEKSRKQKTHQRLRDAEKGQYKISIKVDQVDSEQAKTAQRQASVLQLAEELLSEFPSLAGDIQEITAALRT